ALGAAVLSLLLALTTGSLIAAYVYHDQRDQLEEDKRLLEHANDQTSTALWKSQYAQARAFRWSGRGGRRVPGPHAPSDIVGVPPSLRPEDWEPLAGRPLRGPGAGAIDPALLLRNEAIACTALADLSPVKRWQGRVGPEDAVDFSADLERYARVERDAS